jgi:hypothetical protein
VDKVLDIHRDGLCRNSAFCKAPKTVQICQLNDTRASTGLYSA